MRMYQATSVLISILYLLMLPACTSVEDSGGLSVENHTSAQQAKDLRDRMKLTQVDR